MKSTGVPLVTGCSGLGAGPGATRTATVATLATGSGPGAAVGGRAMISRAAVPAAIPGAVFSASLPGLAEIPPQA